MGACSDGVKMGVRVVHDRVCIVYMNKWGRGGVGYAGTSFGVQRGGHLPPLNLKNSFFWVFAHKILCFLYFAPHPPLGSRSKFCPHGKN